MTGFDCRLGTASFMVIESLQTSHLQTPHWTSIPIILLSAKSAQPNREIFHPRPSRLAPVCVPDWLRPWRPAAPPVLSQSRSRCRGAVAGQWAALPPSPGPAAGWWCPCGPSERRAPAHTGRSYQRVPPGHRGGKQGAVNDAHKTKPPYSQVSVSSVS